MTFQEFLANPGAGLAIAALLVFIGVGLRVMLDAFQGPSR